MKIRRNIILTAVIVATITATLILHANRRKAEREKVLTTYYSTGELKSRSEVADGILNGWSEGYYLNGQLQVHEHYVNGISEGTRTKWYPSGSKKSETEIVNAQVHGHHRIWYENGQLAISAQYEAGVPHGKSEAYYPSGHLKSEVVMEHGRVVSQQFYDDRGSRLATASKQ